jgi:mono/diheme cytochrome c family protein
LKTKALALTAVLAFAGLGLACGSDEKSNPPANNANKPAVPPTNTAPAPAPTTEMAGMPADVATIFGARCAMCHGKDAKGQGKAPNLYEVKDKHTADEWVAYLKNPKIWDKDNTMPPVQNLPEADAKKVADWLAVTTGKPGAKGDDDKGEKKDDKKNEKTEGVKKS